jgi:hypothetical protein
MRYEQQVVLQMPPGSGGQVTPSSNAASAAGGDANASKAAAAHVAEDSAETQGVKPGAKTGDRVALKPAVKAPIVVEKGEAGPGAVGGIHPTLRRGAKDGAPGHPELPMRPAARPVHVTAQSKLAFAPKKSAPKATHAAVPKHHPVATKHPAGTTQHHPTQVAHP